MGKELKLCPFCGDKGAIVSELFSIGSGPTGYTCFIRCTGCYAKIDNSLTLGKRFIDETVQEREERFNKELAYATKEVITTWNRRLKCS